MTPHEQDALNDQAVAMPEPGDYWHEMFCPYFLVVHVRDDQITVLSAMHRPGEPHARVNHDDGTWSLDMDQYMVVDRAWILNRVRYKNIADYVADVVRSDRNRAWAQQWVDHRAQQLLQEFQSLGAGATASLMRASATA